MREEDFNVSIRMRKLSINREDYQSLYNFWIGPKVKEMIPTKDLCVEIHNVMCISLTFNAHKLHFRPFDNINQ